MSKSRRRPKPRSHVVAGALVVVLAAGGVTIGTAALAGGIAWLRPAHVGAEAATLPASSSPPAVQTPNPSPTVARSPTQVPTTLNLLSTEPAAAARDVAGGAAIVLNFDAPVGADALMPTISPATTGSWSRPAPTSLQFVPSTPFTPDTVVTVRVPAALTSTNGGTLAAATTLTYTVADGSVVRLQQLLAELHYLPVTFTPTVPEPADQAGLVEAAFTPPTGDYAMRFPATPTALANLWTPGQLTTMTRGAVMTFESVHQLDLDGIAGYQVWTDLLADAATGKLDPRPYSWAWTTTTKPETLKIWSNGRFIYSSLANTGIPAAPTPHGSWPVFARYRTQTMQGTNPDGTKYKDAGVPYISYFNGGDAIHGFIRGSYGTQQSLGCIELPYSAAVKVWDIIGYGTVVTVT